MNAETEIRPVLTLLRGVRLEGDLSLVTPGPVEHLHERDLAIIAEAERLHTSGQAARAAEMILKLEERLGITQADRLAAAAPSEPWEEDLTAALLGLSADPEPERLGAPPRPFDRLNEPEEKAALAAAAKLARAKTKGNKALATNELVRIDARRHQRVELKERADGIRETVELAKARGEEVDEAPPKGAANIISRDGFAEIAKHFTPAQRRIGERYREGVEARGEDMQASQIRDSGGRGHDNNEFVARRFERAKLCEFVARTDRAVALSCIDTPSALQMLRNVAGAGLSIRAFGAGGRAYARNRAALATALDVALKVELKMAEEARSRAGGPQDAA